MAVDSLAVANKLVAILAGLSGVGAAQLGQQESPAKRLVAEVTMGSQPQFRKAAGLMQRDGRFLVTLVYRVDGNESGAEAALLPVVDAFLAALNADLTLGGLCKSIEVETALADMPEYQARGRREYREYPILVTARQYGSYSN